jgi:hypothetical protein
MILYKMIFCLFISLSTMSRRQMIGDTRLLEIKAAHMKRIWSKWRCFGLLVNRFGQELHSTIRKADLLRQKSVFTIPEGRYQLRHLANNDGYATVSALKGQKGNSPTSHGLM